MKKAELAYEAYRQNTGGISLASGQPIPPFESLSPAIKEAWAAAAHAVAGAAPAVLRCKMRVHEVLQQKDADGAIGQERVTLVAVYGQGESENAEWAKWTPSANFTIHINNPGAFDKLASGHEFFVDFVPAVAPEIAK